MTPWSITGTYELIRVVEQIKLPTTFLSEVFFADREVTLQDVLPVEFVKKNRRLAPMLIEGSRALTMSRERSRVKLYHAPLIGARRTLGLKDISQRMIGEMPVMSTLTPADRALQMQADDLKDLLNMQVNRREAMAASLLTTGAIPIRGFAEDGSIVEEQTLIFDEDWVAGVQTPWSNEAATIYDDLRGAIEYIAEETGTLPDVAICGRNIEGYLLKNTQLKEWYAVQNRANLAMVSFAPKYQSPNARYIGSISALGLELYSYLGTYFDDVSGEVKRYVPDDMIIIGSSRAGKMMFGRVDILKQGQWSSYAGENVPVYTSNEDAQTTSLTIYSRCMPLLPSTDSVRALKVVS